MPDRNASAVRRRQVNLSGLLEVGGDRLSAKSYLPAYDLEESVQLTLESIATDVHGSCCNAGTDRAWSDSQHQLRCIISSKYIFQYGALPPLPKPVSSYVPSSESAAAAYRLHISLPDVRLELAHPKGHALPTRLAAKVFLRAFEDS